MELNYKGYQITVSEERAGYAQLTKRFTTMADKLSDEYLDFFAGDNFLKEYFDDERPDFRWYGGRS